MTQVQLKQSYVAVTVFCSHCQQEQVVHVEALGGFWSMAHQYVECLKCKRGFEVMVSDAIIAGPFCRGKSCQNPKMGAQVHSRSSSSC